MPAPTATSPDRLAPTTPPPPASRTRNLLKTLPGLLISAFFLWYTFRGISFRQFATLHLAHPAWILGVLAATAGSYTLRCVRWTRMMRGTGATFKTCARVLMTSLAANNILPLRIGDVMRIFTYAPDLGTSPSVILSTVVLEKLLDIFVLVLFFVSTMGAIATPRLRLIATISLAVSAVGLLTLLLGARLLQAPVTRFFSRLDPASKLRKLEHWIVLAIEAIARIGIAGSLLLLAQTILIWTCEGSIFVSAIHLIALPSDRIGPWLAMSFSNLSYLIPSSPGAIGPFELAIKTALTTHGVSAADSALFGLAFHAWMLLSVTGAGGLLFLAHRFRTSPHKPLLEDLHNLPDADTVDVP